MILTLLSCREPEIKLSSPSVIPAPQSLQVLPGRFTIDQSTVISNADDFTHSVNFLKSFLEVETNRSWETKYATENVILFEYDASITASEAYIIDSNAQ